MLPTGLKVDRLSHSHRVSSWITAMSVFFAASLSSGMVRAQAVGAAAPGWQVVPTVSVTETYSDNQERAPSSSARGGWMRELGPGIRIQGGGARVKGSLDYRLRDLAYANKSQLNSRQNLLNSSATIEALEKWLFIDASAGITQQNTSAFGAPTNDFAGAGSNRTETTTYRISPYLRGKAPDIVDYLIRFNRTDSRSSGGTIPATETSQWITQFKNAPSPSRLGWSLDSDATTIRNNTVGNRKNGRVRGSLIVDLPPELRASLLVGRENTNYSTTTVQNTGTSGFRLEWSPGPRTQMVAARERRSFGTGRNVLLSHRTPMLALKYTDDKDVGVMSSPITTGALGSTGAMMSELLASSIPDPAARGQAVGSALEQPGGNTTPAGGFATSRISINHNREVSAVLTGKLNTITITLSQRNNQNISSGAAPVTDSFTTSNEIRQQIASIGWAYRLSGLSTLKYNASRSQSTGSGATGIESTQIAHNVSFTTQIGAKTNGSLVFRRAQFQSTAAPGFRENAIVATVSLSF